MDVRERVAGDLERLDALIDGERGAKQRDRYRMVRLALLGWEAADIAQALSSNRRTVQVWVYRYRDGGLDALTPVPRPPRAQRLAAERRAAFVARLTAGPREGDGVCTLRAAAERRAAFVARLTAGPREGDGVCTLRAADARRILREEFGASYSLAGVYDLMHRLGLSCLRPRPRHEKSDPAAMEAFKASAPPLSTPSVRPSSP